MTHKCSIGPGRPPESHIDRANIAFWRPPGANIALMSQIWRAVHKKPFYNLFIITFAQTSNYNVHMYIIVNLLFVLRLCVYISLFDLKLISNLFITQ